MPIKIQDELPAKEVLAKENIFIMDETRAKHQDIRPLRIVILNLMPTKITTESQLLRLIANSPLQVEVDLLRTKRESRNTPKEHLLKFYSTFDEIKDQKYDGMIITGAPVEQMEFEEVDYWEELKEIMDWSVHNVFSTFHICWGAQAGLYHHFKIPKHQLEQKMFGVFKHNVNKQNTNLLRGFDDEFFAPHSRHTEVWAEEIEKNPEIEILSVSDDAGVYIAAAKNGRQIFVTGHSEYDRDTLKAEYERDVDKGVAVPCNYFPDDDPSKQPIVTWRSHANLLFSNWLDYYVYQETPYDVNKVD